MTPFLSRFIIFKRQVAAATRGNLLVRYRQSATGFIWVILNPIIMLAAQSLAFSQILKLQIPQFHLFLISGLLPWIFLVQTVDMTTGLFINTGKITRSYPVSPLVFLTAQLLDNFFNFLAAMIIVTIATLFFEKSDYSQLWYLPLPLFFMFVGAFGLSLFFATMNVFFRDVKFVISFILNVAFFVTPIFYPESFVPDNLRFLISVNPLYNLIRPIRLLFISQDLNLWFSALLTSFFTAAFILIAAYINWKFQKNKIHIYV